MIRSIRLVVASCAAVLGAALAPAAADALVLKPARDCPDVASVKPFEGWGDRADYARVDNGGFDDGTRGWTVSNATVVGGGTPWPAHAPDADRALEIRGSATSPSFCVGLEHPTMRFFARNTGSPLSTLLVEVIVTTSLGIKLAVPAGVVLNAGEWQPSPRLLVVANLLMLLPPGDQTRVAFRFTSIGIGARWRIDDVFVDPYAKI